MRLRICRCGLSCGGRRQTGCQRRAVASGVWETGPAWFGGSPSPGSGTGGCNRRRCVSEGGCRIGGGWPAAGAAR
eukprot:2048280-Prymnesium_polylepis.2